MKQVVVTVRISSSPDMLSSLLQVGPAQGRVKGKEASDHQLKLSCQQTTRSLWLQIHHYSLTGTSKDEAGSPAASHIPATGHLNCRLRLTGCFTGGLRSGKQPGWKPAHCEQGGDWSFFSQICFPNITFGQYKNTSKNKRTFLVSLQFTAKLCTLFQNSIHRNHRIHTPFSDYKNTFTWLCWAQAVQCLDYIWNTLNMNTIQTETMAFAGADGSWKGSLC